MAQSTTTLDFPIYGAQFFDNNTLIVAGGGGEGNNGIQNKLAAISIDLKREKEKLKVIDEFKIEGKNDSPTGLAIHDDTILIGANEATEKVKSGENKHLRKFKYDSSKSGDGAFTFVKSSDVEKSKDPNVYQKLIAFSKSGNIAAFVSFGEPSVLRIVDPETLTLKESVEEDAEIKSIDISTDGKKIAYITEKKLVVIRDSDEPTLSHSRFSSNYSLSKVKFLTKDKVIIGINLKTSTGILLLESGITTNDEGEEILKTKKARVISDKIKKITALDVVNSDLIAVAGNNNTILIAGAESFDVFKTIKKAHSFAITAVAFSPDGKFLASTSAANTVHVLEITDALKRSYAAFYNALIVALLALLFYYAKQNITEDQLTKINTVVYFLFGEDYAPAPASLSTTYESIQSSQSAAIESIENTQSSIIDVIDSVVDVSGENVEEISTDSIEESILSATTTDTVIEYVTSYAIKEGDIVEEKIESIRKELEEKTESEKAFEDASSLI